MLLRRISFLGGRIPPEPAIAIGALLALILIRNDLAGSRLFAGPADSSFYFTLAKGLFAGRGLSIGYVWHFLYPWDTVVHPANDYWQPLAAIIMTAGFKLTGNVSLQSALLMPAAAWALIGALTFVLARRLSLSIAESIWAAVLALSTPCLLERSMLTDTAIFAGLFGCIAILCSVNAIDDPRWFAAAFASVAAGYTVRPDGILALSAVAVAAWAGHVPVVRRLQWLAVGTLVFIACCAPMWILNERTIGMISPTASAKTALFTKYEDLYAFEKVFSLRTYLALGPSAIIISKVKTLVVEFLQMPQLLGWSVLASVIVLAATLRMRILAFPWPLRLAAVVSATQFCFYAFVATLMALPGAFARSFTTVVPFIAVAVAYALGYVVRNHSGRTGILAALVALNMVMSTSNLHRRFQVIDAESRQFILAGDWVRAQQPGGPPIAMTREPWEFTELTGLPSVQIPSDGLEAICHAARKFKASFILMPVPERPELERAIKAGDPRFSEPVTVDRSSMSFVRLGDRCVS